MIETLKVLVKVVSCRDGYVWETRELGERWVPKTDAKAERALAVLLGGDFFTSISTKRMKELGYIFTRTRKEVAR